MKKKLLIALIPLAMRLMIVQTLIAFSAVFSYATDAGGQEALNKRVSLTISNADLTVVLDRVEAIAGVKFVFSPSSINVRKKLTLSLQDKSVKDFLDTYVWPLGIGYKAVGNLIILYDRGNSEELDKISAIDKITTPRRGHSDRQISGTVVNEKEQPVAGVSILIQGTSLGTLTDASGRFSLTIPGSEKVVLQISSVGFQTQTLEVNPGTTTLNIRMSTSVTGMNEVVVIGYGTSRKRDLTGAISSIRPDKIADQNPNTVQDILRGVPGLSVGLDPSAKGGGAIQIRGIRSIFTEGNRNSPLLVLDGTIFYGELSEINPDDIEQIDVLKDASASAVYGAQASNGVLIITTKKGKQGKPRINFTSNLGLVTRAADREVYGPDEYLRYRQDFYTANTYGLNPSTGRYEAYQARNSSGVLTVQPGFYDAPTAANLTKYGLTIDQWRAYSVNAPTATDNEIWARRLLMEGPNLENFLAGRSFNWYNHTFRTGVNQDYNISASGASDRINYYMSFGYLSNEGVAKGNDYKAVRSNLKVDGKITDWLNLGINVNFQNRTDADLAVDWNSQVVRNSPFATYKDANGNLVARPMGDISSNNYGYNYDYDRRFRDLDRGFTILNTIVNAKITLPFNITYSFNAAPRYEFFHDFYWESAAHPNWGLNNGVINREQSRRFDWNINNTIHWEQTFAKKHRLSLTLVQEAEKRNIWQDRSEARNILPTDALGFHEISVADRALIQYNSEDRQETADGMLARLFYSFDDRYMITTSIRRDGYSGFGEANRRANFFSTSFGWTFTNEAFFNLKAMNMGKLRVSWGQNGNRSLGNNPYLALANLALSGTAGYLDNNGTLQQIRTVTMERLANPNLSWEKTESFNAGLDFGFLQNRITGTLDYYITPTVDMIQSRIIPGFTGFGVITTNLGRVENRGFELTLTSQNIRNRNFNWSTTLGFSKYKNTIKHIQGIYDMVLNDQGNVVEIRERNFPANGWFIGHPIGVIWDYRVVGIWQANEAAEAAKYSQRPGDPKVANNPVNDIVNSNGTTTIRYGDEDKEFQGQLNPPVMWSLRNEFNYKNFNFSFNMYSYWGHKSLNNEYQNRDNRISLITNQANLYSKEYWTPDNPTNEFARLEAQGPAGVSAPQRVYDRSFIRLENITLGYTLPNKIYNRLPIQNLKIYGSARNVAVWQKDKSWDYWDIETGQLAPRIITFGLNANF